MDLFLLALSLLGTGGTLALLVARNAKLPSLLGTGSAVIAGIIGLIPAVQALLGKHLSFTAAWAMPYASFSLEIDALSGFFLIIILGLSLLAAIYGKEYMQHYADRHNLGAHWFFFNLLTVSMALVVTAANGVLFLIAWELMAVSSYFLVTFEDERAEVRQAGFIYLVATHLGTAFLLVMFWLLAGQAGNSMDFAKFATLPKLSPALAGVIFVCSVIGFGAKAGIMPFHVWLPEAHPAAPSHVSAIMSGVMIKTGIYGILRICTFLVHGVPPAWWGSLLITIGLISGVLGILFAVSQSDLKRLLAYSSVENIGIVTLGIGIGLLGVSYRIPVVAVLGFLGSFLHIFNHCLMKGLLFFNAGTVLHTTHVRDMNLLGGLSKKMPVSSVSFLVGSVAICGLPPLNGFIGEFCIYLASFFCLTESRSMQAMLGFPVAIILHLAVIGGLAAACFGKAFSIAYLGEARSTHGEHAHDPKAAMLWPMIFLSAACILVSIGLMFGAAYLLQPLLHVVMPDIDVAPHLALLCDILYQLLQVIAIGLGILLLVALLRAWLMSGKSVTHAVTWDCGYLAPNVKMQYTASSFAQPIVDMNAAILRTQKKIERAAGYFPSNAHFLSTTMDTFMQRFYRPLLLGIRRLFAKLDWLQHGHLHLYLLYIAVTLVVLLICYVGLK
jgi:formate hydrogenlyase subunit 3/multisubunit Na+/H+ antiporter MnhD subunit